MSQGDRSQVVQNIRVRTSLKNDTCWIQKPEEENKVQDKERTDQAVENKPVRQNSYVLSTAKRFESHMPTEQPIPNVEAQPEKCVSNMTTENNDEYTDTTVDQSKIKPNEGAVSADVPLETHTPNGEAVFPVEPTGQTAVNTKAENEEIYAHTAVDQSNGELNNAKVTIGDNAVGPVAEISAAAGTEESKDGAEVPNVLPVQLRPEEELSTEMETANATHVMDAGVESTVQPAEGGCEKCPPEQTTEEIVEAVADVLVETSPDMSDVITATPGEEAAPQECVEPVPNMLEKPASELLSQSVAETGTAGSCENGPQIEPVADVLVETSPGTSDVITATPGEEAAVQDSVEPVPNMLEKPASELLSQSVAETSTAGSCENGPQVEPVADVLVETSPGTSDVITATPGEEAAVQDSVEPVPNMLEKPASELLSQSVAETSTAGSCENGPQVEPVADVLVETSPGTSDVITATPGEEAAVQDSVESVLDSLAKSLCESLNRLPVEIATEGNNDNCPLEQAAVETVEAVARVNVASSPEFPVLTNTSGEEATLQQSEESVPNSESPGQPAAETAVKSVESAASAEPVLQTTTGDIIECEVQPADSSLVKQSVEPAPENAVNHVVDLSTEDAIEPVRASDAESVQNEFDNRAIELTDALNVEPPTTGAAAESLKDLEKPLADETKWNNQPDNTHVYRNGVCSFCDKIIYGNVRIIFDEPPVNCHPDCLRCALCARALGDMETPMFLRKQAIICGGCFAEIIKT